jgi:hypothetical protein
MFAFCLRSWRRNGIACDELIFLPGTKHAEKAVGSNVNFSQLPLNLRHGEPNGLDMSPNQLSFDLEVDPDVESVKNSTCSSPLTLEATSNGLDQESPHSSISNGSRATLTPDVATFEIEEQEMVPLTVADDQQIYTPSNLWKACRRQGSRKRKNIGDSLDDDKSLSSPPRITDLSKQHAQQQIQGFLKLFSTLSRETNAYAPSGPIVASAALDLCMPVMLNFHMFMILTHRDGSDDIQIPPQVLPLIFLTILMLRSFIPFTARKRFWGTIHSAASSPFYNVTFRDEIIGEVATSMVRPLQDIFFALFYYFASMYGIFSGTPELEATGSKLEKNIILHNIVLPTCAVLPLISRFLQTLRQAYDEQRRWPYLGNAFKYFTASLVIFYGMIHSEEERSQWWKYCFAICLGFQLWWDLVIDWEVLCILPSDEVERCCFPFISRIQLRSKRLFKNNSTYWKVIVFDVFFRFTWMLSFIPAYHLNWAGEIKHTLSVDLKTLVGFAVSLTELIRRCWWVILRLELETIKMTDNKYTGNSCSAVSSKVQYRWLAPKEYNKCDNIDTPASQRSTMKWAAYRLLVKRLFCLELLLYFSVFISCGLWTVALI